MTTTTAPQPVHEHRATTTAQGISSTGQWKCWDRQCKRPFDLTPHLREVAR